MSESTSKPHRQASTSKPDRPASTPKRAICFLPSGEMLRLRPVSHWMDRFADFTKRTPTEIVLPGVGFSGPLYDSKVHPFPKTLASSNILPNWIRSAREQLGDSGVVWASVIVDGGFLENETLWLRNQYGTELDQLCTVNPVAQEILRDMISETLELGVDGVVLDVTDAFPNSGASEFEGVTANCFCDFCMKGLKLKGFGEPREVFVGDGGLMRLLLKLEEHSCAHIDPTQEWIDQRDAASLVSLSLARKFVSGDRASLEAEALRVLDYMRARVILSAEAFRSILSPCRAAGRRSAIVLGDAAADLTQMATLQSLASANSADEYWLPDAPMKTEDAGEWQAVQFLAARSTYYFNAFFEIVEDATKRFMLQGVNGFLGSLSRASKGLMGNKLAPGSAYTVGKLDQFAGFVGVPLGQDDHIEIIRGLTREVTGGGLPDELLEQFRIAGPDTSD